MLLFVNINNAISLTNIFNAFYCSLHGIKSKSIWNYDII